MTRDIKLYCAVCEKFVGERSEMVMKLLKGTKVNIVCTCQECQKPKYDIPDCLKDIFKI
jgi:RNase P subunit RPR2